MPRVRWTPSSGDATKYDLDGPQIFDTDVLDDLPAGELEDLERIVRAHTGLILADLWPPRDSSVSLARAVMWLTLRLAGRSLDWTDFDPQIRRTGFEPEPEPEDDADPPVDPPVETSSPEE